jgi:spore coat polysaccharide biosynthesis protein SpsF (cytidylyltransferase family)
LRKVVAIVQARMTSTRLPGKVLKEIAGKPVLWHIINRLRKTKLIDEIVVATTVNFADRQILELVHGMGIKAYAGSEADVLDRYYQTAKTLNADVIVRITSDCPLLDSEVVDKVISSFLRSALDYVSNTCVLDNNDCKQTFPDGFDTEVFSFAALKCAWKNASLVSEREHVTPYIWKNPQLFSIGHVSSTEDFSNFRFTLDYEDDLIFIREVYDRLSDKGLTFGLRDIVNLLETNPDLLEINKLKTRNEGYLKSVKSDGKWQS